MLNFAKPWRGLRWLVLAVLVMGVMGMFSSSMMPAQPVAQAQDGDTPPTPPVDAPPNFPAIPTFQTVTPAPYATAVNTSLEIELEIHDNDAWDMVIVPDISDTLGQISVSSYAPIAENGGHRVTVVVNYLPPTDFEGNDVFALNVTDGDSNNTLGSFTVTVGNRAEVSTPDLDPNLTNELIINYDPSMSEDAIQGLIDAVGGVEVERVEEINAIRVAVPEDVNADNFQTEVTQQGFSPQSTRQTVVEDPTTMRIFGYDPILDPLFSNQWSIDTGDIGAMNVILPGGPDPGAWELINTMVAVPWDLGKNIVVAILDTGIDYNHPEFIGRTYLGYDFVNDDNIPQDDNGHGSQVAGIIGANVGNNYGITGIAPLTYILPVKVCNANGICDIFDIAQGIVYAVDNNAKVINISFGNCAGSSSTILGAVNYALSKNVVVIAGAGDGEGDCANPGSFAYPASHNGVISVAAHDINGNRTGAAANDNANGAIDISAPGVDVFTASRYQVGQPAINSFATVSGTSFSAAHITGLATLLVSSGIATSPQDVLEAITCSATPKSPTTSFGAGLARADRAVTWDAFSGDCTKAVVNDDIEEAKLLYQLPYREEIALSSNSASLQLSDPDPICGGFIPSYTIWYQFYAVETGGHLFTTLGSRRSSSSPSLDTVIAVYTGEPNNLSLVGCNDDPGFDVDEGQPDEFTSTLLVQLEATKYYYVLVGVSDVINPTDPNAYLLFQAARAMETANTYYPAWAPQILYTNSWVATPYTGAYDNYVMQTGDKEAAAVFAFRGTGFELIRAVGPSVGGMDVFFNGLRVDFDDTVAGKQALSNQAAIKLPNQSRFVYAEDVFPLGGVDIYPSGYYIVVIRRDSLTNQTAGAINLNYFRTFEDTEYTTLSTYNLWLDDSWDSTLVNPPYVLYRGDGWTDQADASAAYGQVTTTPTANASATFKVVGSGFVVYRTTNDTGGMMDIFVDGLRVANDVSNCSTTTRKQVPYYVTDLANTIHSVTIVNKTHDDTNPDCNGDSQLAIDGVLPIINYPLDPTAYAPTVINGDFSDAWWKYIANTAGNNTPFLDYFLYASGAWDRVNKTLAQYGQVMETTDPNGRLQFTFRGTHLCLTYGVGPGYGSMDIYIDDIPTPTDPATPVATIVGESGADTVAEWCTARPTAHGDGTPENAEPIGLLADTYHRVLIVQRDSDAGLPIEQQTPGIQPVGNGTIQIDRIVVNAQTVLTTELGLHGFWLPGYLFESPLNWTINAPDQWYFPLAWGGDLSQGGFYNPPGYLQRFRNTVTDNTRITFYINGSGFILYTAISSEPSAILNPQGRHGSWQVFIDNNPVPYELAGVPVNDIELAVQRCVQEPCTGGNLINVRYSPFAFGFSNLGVLPGIHKVTLVAKVDANESVDFGGIRVLP